MVDGCPQVGTPPVMCNFSVTTDTDRAGCEDCAGSHSCGDHGGSGSDFTKCQSLQVTWFQSPKLNLWTWYSSGGDMAKEINHILVGRFWRLLQNLKSTELQNL